MKRNNINNINNSNNNNNIKESANNTNINNNSSKNLNINIDGENIENQKLKLYKTEQKHHFKITSHIQHNYFSLIWIFTVSFIVLSYLTNIMQKSISLSEGNEKLITYKGKSQSIKAWCEELNLNYSTVKSRLSKLNYSVEKAFSVKKGANNG